MKQQILGTGLSGLVGSRIVELLNRNYEFTDLSFDTGIDITNAQVVEEKFKESQAEWVLHLAAKASVDGCEEDKNLGQDGAAWKINVEGTRNIIQAATVNQKKVLYISTDFVFDGTKENCTELDTPNPLNWYAQTKYEGEKIVLENPENLVVRIAYPYRSVNILKKDFVHNIFEQLKLNKSVQAVTDHFFCPTFIDDIVKSIEMLIKNNCCGIYHMVGSECLTPFVAAQIIAQVFNQDKNLIQPATIADFYKNRAARPYKLCLKNDKIKKLGFTPKTFKEGLEEIKKQGFL